jgi:ribosomal-protein-alanine N-acetyltransferase
MLLIRTFKKSDIPQVTSIISDTFGRNYNSNFYLSIFEKWEGGFLVAQSEREIVGVLTAMISAPKEARILLMATRPQYRNRGMGTQLLSEFILRCYHLNLKAVNLEVRISNEPGIRFYIRHGFLIKGIINTYYEDGEAGYVMKKLL